MMRNCVGKEGQSLRGATRARSTHVGRGVDVTRRGVLADEVLQGAARERELPPEDA